MAPVYRHGDVLIYRRPKEDLTLRPGDDVLVLLPDPAGSQQLVLRRLARWDEKALELRALNADHPAIREHPRNAVLCGKVIGRLARRALE
jgi:phage repressor protein C with HTH and peptisase S24 domain